MSEFKKPKKIFVKDKAYIKSLINASLEKDLCEGEELCSVCHGTGMTICNNVYGLEGDPDKRMMFPYRHQSLSFCQNCYNGIVHRCKLCGELMPKGYLKHNCEAQRELDRIKREKEEAEEFANAPLASPDIIKDMQMFYSDHYDCGDGYFGDWETFFDYWFDEHEPEEPRPEYVWATESVNMKIDADRVLETATEDLYEDAFADISDQEVNELQSYLDDFCKRCGVGTTYYRGKYKVRIPWEEAGIPNGE